jgi:UDP-N-acetyl-D-galactosamine dehydrogenase
MFRFAQLNDTTLAVIGLGQVGLRLAVEIGRHRPVIGFDDNPDRVHNLQCEYDHTRDVSDECLAQARHLAYTSAPREIAHCRTYIVTVPMPVDTAHRPDTSPLVKASETVGRLLKRGDLVIFDNTNNTASAAEICVPLLEHNSGLRFNHNFFCWLAERCESTWNELLTQSPIDAPSRSYWALAAN